MVSSNENWVKNTMIANRTNIIVDDSTRISIGRVNIIEEFAEHFASFLNLDMIKITFYSKRVMSGLRGSCDDKGNVEISVSHDLSLMLSTIAHELCHAAQYKSKCLVVSKNTKSTHDWYWRGEYYSSRHDKNSPWEQEALQFEYNHKSIVEFFANKIG